MDNFADRAQALTVTAGKVARLQNATDEASLLETAKATLVQTGYDNWNDGTDLYTLMLDVPVDAYASIEEHRGELETALHRRIAPLVRGYGGCSITDVVIAPVLVEPAIEPIRQIESDGITEPVPGFWQPGFFRLFISHQAVIKAKAHALKEALALFQIASFVAHDDIEPTKEWQSEIESALRTMDGLSAMISPGFEASRWCDQEVGFALGRGKLVIPIRLEADPHGFMGKFQGLQGKGMTASGLAQAVFDILIRHPLSTQRMTEALVDRLQASRNWDAAKRNIGLLEGTEKLNPSQVGKLMRAIEDNDQVSGAWGVPDRIKRLIERAGKD